MKKAICFLFALVMLLSCFEIASADGIQNPNTSFNDRIHCQYVTDPDTPLADWAPVKDNQKGAIYIYHNVTTKVKTKHNNLFYISGSDDYESPFYSHWLTPGVNRRCASSRIDSRVYVSARGNTKYYEDNSSITTIQVKGSIGWKK